MADRIGNPPRSLAPEMADAGAWRHGERNPGSPAIVAQPRPRAQPCVVREAVLELHAYENTCACARWTRLSRARRRAGVEALRRSGWAAA